MTMKYVAEVGDKAYAVAIDQPGQVTVNGRPHTVDLQPINDGPLYSIILDGVSHEVFVDWNEGAYIVMVRGERYVVRVEDERLRTLAELGRQRHPEQRTVTVKAPMPGLVVKIPATPGGKVSAGQPVVILEAMKMENEIRAPRSGTVKSLRVKPGQTVNQGDVLAVIE